MSKSLGVSGRRAAFPLGTTCAPSGCAVWIARPPPPLTRVARRNTRCQAERGCSRTTCALTRGSETSWLPIPSMGWMQPTTPRGPSRGSLPPLCRIALMGFPTLVNFGWISYPKLSPATVVGDCQGASFAPSDGRSIAI